MKNLQKETELFIAFSTDDSRNAASQSLADISDLTLESLIEEISLGKSPTQYVEFHSADRSRKNVENEVQSKIEDNDIEKDVHLAKVKIIISIELIKG